VERYSPPARVIAATRRHRIACGSTGNDGAACTACHDSLDLAATRPEEILAVDRVGGRPIACRHATPNG